MPPLKRLHRDWIFGLPLYRRSLEFWRTQSTDRIIHSLQSGAKEPLIADDDGIVLQGNTRIKVLEERGYSVNLLPRVPRF
jgi:hypothetical protein